MRRIRSELGPQYAIEDLDHQIKTLEAHIHIIHTLQVSYGRWESSDVENKKAIRLRLLQLRQTFAAKAKLPSPTYMVHKIDGQVYHSDPPALQERQLLYCGDRWIIPCENGQITLRVKVIPPTTAGYDYEVTEESKTPDARVPGAELNLHHVKTKKTTRFIYFHSGGISLLFTMDGALVKSWRMYHPDIPI